jgi:hypothetical protein
MNYAVKLSVELISVPVFSRYGILSENKLQKSDFLGHPIPVKMVGNDFSIHSWNNQTHFVL